MEIMVDGKTYGVEGGDSLLHACLSLGLNLPYFCWHPALGSVGACRQCAVTQFHDADDQHGRIVMACMTPVAEGMRIAIAAPEAAAFRAAVIEWLMTNHPHDCPVCPEGGECHLQDMTVMTGHVRRRYRFGKRTFRNQYLGPFIHHEMNRCIACYRCVRFYRNYAGGRDFDVFGSHRNVFFGRHQDGVLDSEFAGNLAEVCPTGVFTDKTLEESYVRKWDLRGAPSVCVHCGLGCNTHPNERGGRLRRVLNRYNRAVNGYFLCDRGRFGYGFANSAARIRTPLPKAEALARVRAALAGGRVVGIGSPRASLEANFALRQLVGADHFHLGLSLDERRQLDLIVRILRTGPTPAATIADAERADAILVLGQDLPNTAPRLALALRQAVRGRSFDVARELGIPPWQDGAVREAAPHHRSPLFIATPAATRLDDVAERVWRLAPDDIARLGFAVAQAGNQAGPADDIARALAAAQRPLIVAGVDCGGETIIQAAANVAWALPRARLCLTVPECDSLGLALMGGGDLDQALVLPADTLVVLENDLYRRADRDVVDRALTAAGQVIVIDHLMHDTAARAGIVLPAATFAEADGTLVSGEGRAQRFFQVFPPDGDIQASWRWLRDAGAGPWSRFDEVTAACARALPALAAIVDAAPSADYRMAGARIAREPARRSGRTADLTVRVQDDPDTPLSFTMEGYYGPMPAPLLPYAWAPGWNSVQAINKFQQEVGGPMRGGDPGLRLIEPASGPPPPQFTAVSAAFAPRPESRLIVALHEVFGSEELSRLAPAVAELVPAPYLALGADDAAGLGLADGDLVTLMVAGTTVTVAVRTGRAVATGIAGLFGGPPGLALPAWGRLMTVRP